MELIGAFRQETDDEGTMRNSERSDQELKLNQERSIEKVLYNSSCKF